MFEIEEDANVLISAGLFVKSRKPSAQSLILWSHGDYYYGQANFGSRLAGEFYSHSDKRQYSGAFDGQGRLCNEGAMEYKDDSGRKYVGEFVDGKPHGQGRFTWKEGNTYNGQFENGKQNGFGELYVKNLDKTFQTYWVNGELQD